MMDLAKLLQTTPEGLAKLQHDSLKAHAISVLRQALKHMESGETGNIKVFFSPSGGGHGSSNHCIDFSIPGSGVPMDISEISEMLSELKCIIKESKP